ncbi:MAG: efflux RND transporter periplasmic adaptor subunit [Bryobacteraceae bacterium]
MRLYYAIPFCAMLAVSCSKPAEEEAEPKPVVAVKVVKAETQDLTVVVTAPATIFPREQANVTSRMTAPIQTIRVRKGEAVKSGQSLATLDHSDLDAQRVDAQAQLADAQATLERTQQGTIPADLDQKRGAIQLAEAALNQAQLNADRRAQLFQEGAIPQRDLLQAQTDLAQAKTTRDVAKRALDFAETQTNDRDIRSARARVDSARAKVTLAETQLQYTEIRAPFSGTISDQFVFAGDLADTTRPLFQIMDLAVVNAHAQVPEDEARSVHPGQGCSFVPVDTSLGTFTGTVTVINQAVDAQRRTVEIWCQIDNPNARLNGNVFGEVHIIVRQISKAVVVPIAAIEIQQGQSMGTVLVVDDKNIAHRVEVEPGEKSGGMIQLKSGVKAGDTVVIEGGYALPDGTAVQVGAKE